MDEAITVQVWNSIDFLFTKFVGILSNGAREKAIFSTLESLAKFLKDKTLQINNHYKATANYAKQFTENYLKSLSN